MKSLLPRLAWASAGLAVACGLASRATANDHAAPLPCPEPCAPAHTVCASTPKVIVEVPPPNVIIRAAAAPCAPQCKETLFQKICHFNCHPHHQQRVLVQPMAIQPQVVQPQVVQPMAVQPMAVQQHVFVQPQAVQPVAVQHFAVQPFAVQPQAVQPFAVQPFAIQPQAVQPFAVHPIAVQPQAVQPQAVQPQAVQPNAVPPVAATGETCDAALRRVASQMETLTKVVETHTQVLISHEERLQQLERWAKDVNKVHPNATPAPAPADAGVLRTFPMYTPPAPKQ